MMKMRIKKYFDWLKEDFAEVGNVNGMGDIIAPIPGNEGSGDIFSSLGKISTQLPSEILSSEKSSPSFFTSTHYRMPTEKEIEEIDSFNLNAQEIVNGITYNIVGKGIKSNENVAKISQAIELLIKKFPGNLEYLRARKLVEEF